MTRKYCVCGIDNFAYIELYPIGKKNIVSEAEKSLVQY